MSLREKYQTILGALAPAGAIGVSLVLGSALPAAANEPPASLQPQAAAQSDVADRLAAIRAAVSDVAGLQAAEPAKPDAALRQLAWGNWWHPYYRGYGYGWPNWNNWHNWHNWGNWFHNW